MLLLPWKVYLIQRFRLSFEILFFFYIYINYISFFIILFLHIIVNFFLGKKNFVEYTRSNVDLRLTSATSFCPRDVYGIHMEISCFCTLVGRCFFCKGYWCNRIPENAQLLIFILDSFTDISKNYILNTIHLLILK